MPKDKALRVEIIRLHHNMPMEGHWGQWKITKLVIIIHQNYKIPLEKVLERLITRILSKE